MGVWENRQGSGVGSCNLPRATDQTGPDLSPPRTAGGLRAGGPGRGKDDHQLHPKEVTQGQKAEAAGQGSLSLAMVLSTPGFSFVLQISLEIGI